MKNEFGTFFKSLKIGFKGRLLVCFLLIVSVSFYTFNNPFIRLFATLTTLVTAELFLYCYVPLYLDNLSLMFKTKTIERPLPDELLALSKAMGLKVKKMKIFPKVLNAYARGNQLFIGERLIEKLNAEQIKAVVAHEFGHMKERHAIVQILYIMPIMVFVSLIWSQLPPILVELGLISYMMVVLVPIQWVIERRADRAAAKYVGKESIKSALLAIADKDRLDEPSESHPPINKRLKWIDNLDLNAKTLGCKIKAFARRR
jgi:Zn-dependent protease with chaperone function